MKRAWWGFALAALAFVLKLTVLVQLRDHPLTHPDAGLDTTAYVGLAKQVLAGDVGLGPGLYYVSPLYIYFLAAGLAIFDSFTAVRLVQIVLGAASVGFIYLTAGHWFGERAARIAGVLAALSGLFTFYEVLILQSSIDAFLTSAALYFLTRGLLARAQAGRVSASAYGALEPPVHLSVAGFIFGLQTLNRPNMLVAAAGLGVVLLIVGGSRSADIGGARRLRAPAFLLAGLLIGMAPAAIRNAVVAGQWSFVSSHGGLNFYIGNSERATGFYTNVPGITPTIAGQEKDARLVAERALGRPVTDADTSSYFFGLAWTWIRDHPGDALGLFARKFYYVFNAAHVPLPHSYPFFASDANTALRFYAIGPWLLIPLGLAGLAFASPLAGRREYVAFASFVPLYAASVALFFVAERYRLPLLVPLCVGAGAALGSGLQIITRRGSDPGARAIRRPDPKLVAATIVLAVAANWPLALNDGRWDEGLRLAQRFAITARYDEADRWVAHINASDPSRAGAAHYGLGEQLLLLNQVGRALAHLAAAHEADPSEPRVEYALGRALLKAGRAKDAVPHLRRGFEAGIEIPGGGFDYAVALHETGDPAVAGVIKRVRPSEIDDVEVWLRLGRMAAQARAPDIAEPFFRHGAEMRPDFAAARQQYGLNLMVLGRFEDAARELGEAVRLDPRDPDSLAALGYCELRRGRVAEARAHAAGALTLDPGNALAGVILRGGGSR